MERPTCKKCASPNLVVIESGPHLKLICADCNTYQKFITKAEAELYLKKENKNDEIKALESRIAELEAENIKLKAEWFEKGRKAVMRRNQSGCCCIINDSCEIIEACGAHQEWLEQTLAGKGGADA